MRTIVFALTALALMSCDPNAKASSKGGDQISSEKQSRQYESCGATVHCQTGLRCLEHVCVAQRRSAVGDYHAAAGRRSLAKGEPDDAVRHYASAVSAYSTAKIDPPISLYCEQGKALAAAKSDTKNAELAAKVLHHRCLQKIPVGSRYRMMALAALAELGDVGLDPGLLARAEAADRYLTKAAVAPKVDKVNGTVTSTVRTRARSFTALMDAIKAPPVIASMQPCLAAFVKATKKKSVVVSLPFRSRFQQGQFEEDDGYRLKMEKASPPSDPAAGAAYTCVRAIVEPLIKPIARKGGSWKGNVSITLAL